MLNKDGCKNDYSRSSKKKSAFCHQNFLTHRLPLDPWGSFPCFVQLMYHSNCWAKDLRWSEPLQTQRRSEQSQALLLCSVRGAIYTAAAHPNSILLQPDAMQKSKTGRAAWKRGSFKNEMGLNELFTGLKVPERWKAYHWGAVWYIESEGWDYQDVHFSLNWKSQPWLFPHLKKKKKKAVSVEWEFKGRLPSSFEKLKFFTL